MGVYRISTTAAWRFGDAFTGMSWDQFQVLASVPDRSWSIDNRLEYGIEVTAIFRIQSETVAGAKAEALTRVHAELAAHGFPAPEVVQSLDTAELGDKDRG